jgi:hypothetical protein
LLTFDPISGEIHLLQINKLLYRTERNKVTVQKAHLALPGIKIKNLRNTVFFEIGLEKKWTIRESPQKLTRPSMIKVKLSLTAYRPDSTLWMHRVRPLQGPGVDGQE